MQQSLNKEETNRNEEKEVNMVRRRGRKRPTIRRVTKRKSRRRTSWSIWR